MVKIAVSKAVVGGSSPPLLAFGFFFEKILQKIRKKQKTSRFRNVTFALLSVVANGCHT